MLDEHLNEIVLCKDGVEMERWDVAECPRTREVDERNFPQKQTRTYK